MEIEIVTSKPYDLSIDEIRKALEDLGNAVASIRIFDRIGNCVVAARYGETL